MTDISLDNTKGIYVDTDIANFLQQIDIIFGTERSEVVDSGLMGTDFRRYIYDPTVSCSAISRELTDLIERYCTLAGKFDWSVTAKAVAGDYEDIIVVDMDIHVPGGNGIKKTYTVG